MSSPDVWEKHGSPAISATPSPSRSRNSFIWKVVFNITLGCAEESRASTNKFPGSLPYSGVTRKTSGLSFLEFEGERMYAYFDAARFLCLLRKSSSGVKSFLNWSHASSLSRTKSCWPLMLMVSRATCSSALCSILKCAGWLFPCQSKSNSSATPQSFNLVRSCGLAAGEAAACAPEAVGFAGAAPLSVLLQHEIHNATAKGVGV